MEADVIGTDSFSILENHRYKVNTKFYRDRDRGRGHVNFAIILQPRMLFITITYCAKFEFHYLMRQITSIYLF